MIHTDYSSLGSEIEFVARNVCLTKVLARKSISAILRMLAFTINYYPCISVYARSCFNPILSRFGPVRKLTVQLNWRQQFQEVKFKFTIGKLQRYIVITMRESFMEEIEVLVHLTHVRIFQKNHLGPIFRTGGSRTNSPLSSKSYFAGDRLKIFNSERSLSRENKEKSLHLISDQATQKCKTNGGVQFGIEECNYPR